MNYTWLIIALFFVIFELTSPTLFYFLTIAISSFCTFLISICNSSIEVQIVTFITGITTTSFALYGLTKRIEKPIFKTNVFALQGKYGIVLKEITPYKTGTVIVDGQVWSAQSPHPITIKTGIPVEITGVKGIKLIVHEKHT